MQWKRLRGLLTWKLIGPAAVVAAIVWAGPRQVWDVLSGAHLGFVAAALGLAVPLALLKGVRWKTLLHVQDVPISFRESTGMYAMGMTMAAVTPGHLGDFAKIFPLRDRGCGMGRAVAYNVLDRLLDVAFVLLAGYAGLWYFSSQFVSQLWIANIVIAGGLVAVLLVFARRRFIKTVALKLVPEKYKPAVRDGWQELVGGARGHSVSYGAQLALWTLAFWPIQFFSAYLCARALDMDVSFL